MKTKSKTTNYIIHSIATAVLLLTAQLSLAGSATWLLSPQDSAWENPNNWTSGGPPNGPSEMATFAQSSLTSVNISTTEEVNSIVFTADSAAYVFSIGECTPYSCDGQLLISGTGLTNNSSVSQQNFVATNWGQLIFNNASTAATVSIVNKSGSDGPGETIFNDSSSAASASIYNWSSCDVGAGATTFNDASTAGHASIINDGPVWVYCDGATTSFNDSSSADGATLIARAGDWRSRSAGIYFSGASTGGTARVQLSGTGYLDITGHQSGLTIGSIEGVGGGHVHLGANNLRVGTNGLNTSFSGTISGTGSLTKVGSGVLTLQSNHCIAESVGLNLVTGSTIKLDFTGPPDVIAFLKVNGVSQPPGIYGGPLSGAPHIVLQFTGSGTVSVGPVSTLGNISTRAFVQRGDDVMIGGFIVEGPERKKVMIRAIGPGLIQYGVPNVLANPTLELHDGTGALIASNDNWLHTIIGGIIPTDQVADIRNSGYAPGDGRESAIIAEHFGGLPAGNYTAIVRGLNNTAGVALMEVYDLSPETNSTLSNISTRGFVQTGDDVMIGGFIVEGGQSKRVIVRAIGPELTRYGVPNALANPTLELHDSNGALIASNDNWLHTVIGGIITADQVHDIRNSGHAPTDGRESAITADLPPGNYTAIVRGVNNTTGVALVEVYDLIPKALLTTTE
jgi:hypothetical protein